MTRTRPAAAPPASVGVEVELQLRAALLEAQSEASPDGIVVLGPDGRILSWNQSFARMWHLTPEVLSARSNGTIIGGVCERLADPEEFRSRLRHLQRHPAEVSHDEIRLKDRSVFHCYSSPIWTDEGWPGGRVWFFRDVTEQRRAEERLRFLAEASRLLSSSLDHAATLERVIRLLVPELADISALDLIGDDGQIHRLELAAAEPEVAELMEELRRRYPPSPDDYRPAAEALRTSRPVLLAELDEVGLRARTTEEEHRKLIRQTGLSAQLAVPLIARGHAIGVLLLCYARSGRRFTPADVDFALELGRRIATAVDHAALYRTAERASRAKSDFLAVMSHELRTPLNAIVGYADLWLLGLPEPLSERMRPQVERVAWSARHLQELIEQILTFSRLDAGREDVQLAEVPLGELVSAVATLIEPVALRRGLIFRVREADPAARLRTDHGKVRQILLSLLSNAVKFTQHGEVSLEVRVASGHVEFHVRDTGIGIPPEHLERIFEPFWQVEQSVFRHVEGTGLGLSVARQLARLLGGEVGAESEPGTGSTFVLRLPDQGPPAG